jgi:hypothetical protein
MIPVPDICDAALEADRAAMPRCAEHRARLMDAALRRRSAPARRRVLVLLAAVALAVVLALPAAAVPNRPGPVDVSLVLPPSETGCAFDVLVAATGQAKTTVLPDGTVLFTSPALFAAVTNLSTGASVSLTITGALRSITRPDGANVNVATGSNLLWGGVEDALVLAQGTFTWTFYPDGSVSPQAGSGRLTDVCALIT